MNKHTHTLRARCLLAHTHARAPPRLCPQINEEAFESKNYVSAPRRGRGRRAAAADYMYSV